MQRLRHPDPGPGDHEERIDRKHEEDRPPRREEQDQLADIRREHRHQHESHEHEAHHPRHRFGLEQVADHRDDEHPRRCGGRSHQYPPGDEHRKTLCDAAQQREDSVQGDTCGHDRLAPEAVGERPPDQLGRGEAHEIGDDDELALVLLRNVQRLADLRQRRDHRVDGEGVERHQRGEHGGHLARAWALHAIMGHRIEHGPRLLAD